ncbi:MAG TPA: MFS transporter [Ktedonobacterales bacterium]|nr:MFS transporter [Ktedonobacterales bacterium]
MTRPTTSPHGQPAPERAPDAETPSVGAQSRAKRGALAGFSSLRHRNFRLFWFGQMVSLVGTYMQVIGQAWLVLELTNSPVQLGLVGALQALPILLLALLGGVFADRWPKRRVLLITQAASMVQALLLWALIATHAIQLWHIYALAVLLGLTNSLGRPASRAFIVEMVGRADVPNAVALNSSLATLARIVGPGVGGVIIAASGVTALFLFNALSFLPVLAALALIHSGDLRAQAPQTARGGGPRATMRSLREGVGYVWKSPAVLHVIVVAGLVMLFGSNFNVVLPLFATDALHRGASAFGFLSAAIGSGALLAALWLAWANRAPTIRGLLFVMLLFGALEAVFAVTHDYLLSLALIGAVGFAENTFATQSLTLLYALVPDHLRGRVMGVQVIFFDGSVPMGYLLLGWLSSVYGASTAILIGAALALVVTGAGWLWRKPAERGLLAHAA